MVAPFCQPNHRQRRNQVKPLASVKRYLFDILMERERGCCIWCGRRVSRAHPVRGRPYPHDLATLDRIITGKQGGHYVVSNLVLACHGCNKDRADTPALAYAARRGAALPAEVLVALAARDSQSPEFIPERNIA